MRLIMIKHIEALSIKVKEIFEGQEDEWTQVVKSMSPVLWKQCLIILMRYKIIRVNPGERQKNRGKGKTVGIM